jgi:hypothetical protein
MRHARESDRAPIASARSRPSSAGRWGALAALDARIRAADLEGFEPYREPKPLIRKQFPADGPDSRGIYRTTVIDPEDEDYTPPGEPKRRRALAR